MRASFVLVFLLAQLSFGQTAVVRVGQANTATASFTLDMSAATGVNPVLFPVQAGGVASVNGAIVYDPTGNNLHAGKSSADALIVQTTATPGNGNCANWINSGGSIKLGDTGAACGSGGGSGGGVLTYSGPTLSILSGTAFCPVGGGGACSATETNVDIDSAAVSTVSNMYVQLSVALGVGNSVAITWRKNASSQTVTCTISGASATACNDTTHSFAVAQADLLDYQLVFTATIIVTPTILIMSQFGTVNAGVTSVFGNTGPTVGATGDIGATGTVLQVNGAVVPASATATATNASRQIITATFQGNGAKVQLSTGSTVTGHCVQFDANGNTVDTGTSCSPYVPFPPLTVPPAVASGWTAVNAASATFATNANGSITLSNVADATNSEHLECRTAPATPWTLTVGATPAIVTINFAEVGISMRESGTGKLYAFGFQSNGSNGTLVLNQWTNPTTVGTNLAGITGNFFGPLLWLQEADNGTNVSFNFSTDGVVFNTIFSQGRTAFMAGGPNQVCLNVNPRNASYTIGNTVYSWAGVP